MFAIKIISVTVAQQVVHNLCLICRHYDAAELSDIFRTSKVARIIMSRQLSLTKGSMHVQRSRCTQNSVDLFGIASCLPQHSYSDTLDIVDKMMKLMIEEDCRMKPNFASHDEPDIY